MKKTVRALTSAASTLTMEIALLAAASSLLGVERESPPIEQAGETRAAAHTVDGAPPPSSRTASVASPPEEPLVGPSTLFGLSNVIDVHLHMEVQEWEKMQPSDDARLGFLSMMMAFEDMLKDAAREGHFRSGEATRPGLAGYLGVNHQYGRADVTIDGVTIAGVGLRYKGNGTFLEGQRSKKFSYKIDFNEYDDELEFRGLTKLNLNSNVADPSMLREALSYELFREAGIPCSRVGFARVSITVPGEFERRPRGLYTVVEQVDKRFLKSRYGAADGLLLKPSTFGVFRYFGDDWAEHEVALVPKTKARPAQQQRVIEFARLLHQADDASFEQQVDDYLDMDEFLRFLAVNALLCNLDSFLGATQNYYVYLEPESNKFQFLPWDMDHSFGAFPLLGTKETRARLSIHRPGGKKNVLVERVLGIPRHRETYRGYLATYMNSIFEEEQLRGQVIETVAFVRPLVAANGKGAEQRFSRIVGRASDDNGDLLTFVRARRRSVQRQLDGESKGVMLFEDKVPEFPVRKIIGFTIALLVVLLLNFAGWIWAAIAGFRGGLAWGFLNLCFYPIAPAVYGFCIRRELGKRSAIWSTFAASCVVVWIIGIVVTFFP